MMIKKYISPTVSVMNIEPLSVVCLSTNNSEAEPNVQYSKPDTFEELDNVLETLE
jgi:hypothetical protein